MARGEDGVDHAFRMVCYKALPQSNFELSFANQGDPVSFTITFDLEADGDKNLIDFISEDWWKRRQIDSAAFFLLWLVYSWKYFHLTKGLLSADGQF